MDAKKKKMEGICLTYQDPIRVLHYIKHLETGGGEGLVFNLYQHMDRNIVQFDFAVNTAEEERLDKKIVEMGGRIYPICNIEPRITPIKLLKTTKGFEELLAENHYDVVHIHCSNGQGLYYSNIARKRGVKNIICHIHNTSVVGRYKMAKMAVHNRFKRKYMYAPTEYMACSLAAANWLYSNEVIRGTHFQVLKNGIDIDRFQFSEHDRRIIREELGFRNNKVLCTIGRCVKEKNQIFVIKVLENLLETDDSYRLILIGQGELEKELQGYAYNRGIDKYIAFIKSTDCVEKYMSASDFFLLPSASSEGLGIVAIESQANGLNTIISDNVPDDVLISPFCKKFDLSYGVNAWAREIKMSINTEQRQFAGRYIKAAGYEICDVAKNLQAFYVGLIEK